MRIKSIEIEWFRGAAEIVSLAPQSKSMVVYGENGSGKSSFVDALEFVLKNGKIRHLSHEYSGKHQEKAIVNTHAPAGRKTRLHIKFKDGSELKWEIKRDGSFMRSGAETTSMATWDYQRTILRQDEVASFIQDTKGGKYSTLLPLLGLHHMEVAAENLRQLSKSVEQESKLWQSTVALREVASKRKILFGAATDEQIYKMISDLHAKYCVGKGTTTDPLSHCKEFEAALKERIAHSSAEQKRYLTLQAISGLNLKSYVDEVRSESLKLSSTVEPLIAEKLEVLQSAGIFVDKLEEETAVKCPACGRAISVDDFKAHVKSEKERLQDIINIFNNRKAAIGSLCNSLTSLKSNLNKSDVKSWRDELNKKTFSDNLAYIDGLNVESLRASCSENDLVGIENNLLTLIDAASSSAGIAPPDVQQLSTDSKIVEVAKAIIESKKLADDATRDQSLISFLNVLEQGVREEIRLQSKNVIGEISSDIQKMWAILHPGEAIADVSLYLPSDADKAIDIGLKFYGIEQDSPRLTLSEGYRNSLGLCIFLAMAKREADKDRPLFLDDVVISLDRNHRGMIVELLEKEFSGRQVVILTHDREWYTELRQQLDGGNWIFSTLMPYEKPEIGIRLSAKTSTFDDARALLKVSPDSAGNTARKIMDIELAIVAERVKVRLPYLYREKNDHRTAHDFLLQFISDGKKCFTKLGTKEHESYAEAIDALRDADKLLLSWGNRATHSFDVVKKEAEKLIEVCERALDFFGCSNCKKPVYKLDDTGAELVQCQCGQLRWRYGKT